jgi:type II secretory pathway pseudopilin PulG
MKKKAKSHQDGYILMEILVALIIACIVFAILLGAVAHSAYAVHSIDETIKQVIQERNAYVENRPTVFNTEQE